MKDIIAIRKERARKRSAAWRADNPDRATQLMLQSHQKRKDDWTKFLAGERERYRNNEPRRLAKLARQHEARAANPEKQTAYSRRHYEANKEHYAEKCAYRRTQRIAATPPWCDRSKIAELYLEAQRLTQETGVPHEVDHIIPLSGKRVCGLHIPQKMQIITRRQNRTKHNRLADGASFPQSRRDDPD
jgi:flagellum-specific peptidoglycan hydrolase FlgJ